MNKANTNIEHRTPNVERRNISFDVQRSMLDVRRFFSALASRADFPGSRPSLPPLAKGGSAAGINVQRPTSNVQRSINSFDVERSTFNVRRFSSSIAARTTKSALALVCLITLAGCPEVAKVQVTIKPVAGAAAAGGTESAATETAAAGYGNLTGTFTFDGAPPDLRPLVASGDQTVKDPAVCAAVAVPDESLVVNPDNKGLANVVIFLEKRPANVKPELAQPPAEPVYFDQKGCRFMPHIVTVQIGQPLLVVSGDPIPHNTHTNPQRNNSFNQAIAADDRKGVLCKYTKPEAQPISVVCDFHAWMKAWHFPVDHPYVAVSDKYGKFKIEGLPAGTHAFNVWHERGPGGSHLLERKLQVKIEPDKDNVKDFSYGAAKFAAVVAPAPSRIASQRLERGGEISVSLKEGH